MITYQKQVGETSLETLTRARDANAIPAQTPMTYAGTLDPMAEGLLLILIGDECKNKLSYAKLDKTYEVEVLFGISTDTGDVLGLVTSNKTDLAIYRTVVEDCLRRFIGKSTAPYHPFSHKKVGGKPLFQHAKDGTIGEIELPRKEVEIKEVALLDFYHKSATEIKEEIARDVAKVTGDFRQSEVLEKWEKFFANTPAKFPIAKLSVTCTSGTYMRSLAEELGQKLATPALAYSINRTKIGNYKL